MKKVLWFILVLAVVLAFPVSNLFRAHKPHRTPAAGSFDPLQENAVLLFETKCVDCHSEDTDKPFYARIPIVSSIIANDVKRAKERLNIPKECFGPAPVSEAVLAKIQHVMDDDTMPPSDYRLMHWGSGLASDEKAALLAWIRNARAKANSATDPVSPLYTNPLLPIEEPKGLNPDKVALGRKLYHEKRMSGDNTLSCASCHDLKKGGTDQAQYSTGIRGQKGGINAPTVYNATLAFVQFWDGRAPDLQAQAAGPVANPVEMGGNWDDVPGKLKTDPEYAVSFAKLYPQGITKETVTDAIATFEKTLVTANSRFDRFLRGEANALTAEEKTGYRIFTNEGCAKCHVGQALGGKSFEKLGLYGDYFAARGRTTPADDGRYSVTRNESDRHKFKVPTLRNIAVTPPYLHDGSTSDLKQVVQIMGKYQLGHDIPDREAELVVKFLQTLTGEYNGKPLL